jgi:dethiobiotin synthetase
MNTKQQQEQADKLKDLAKKPNLTDKVRKVLIEKAGGLKKPFNK